GDLLSRTRRAVAGKSRTLPIAARERGWAVSSFSGSTRSGRRSVHSNVLSGHIVWHRCIWIGRSSEFVEGRRPVSCGGCVKRELFVPRGDDSGHGNPHMAKCLSSDYLANQRPSITRGLDRSPGIWIISVIRLTGTAR